MSWRMVTSTCRQTARLAARLLDGGQLTAADRLHAAACAACTREVERVARFDERLTFAAQAALDEVPERVPAARALRSLPRVLVPAAMLVGAAAAGLLLAAVVGLRVTPPAERQIDIGSVTSAQDGLAALSLACRSTDGGLACESRAADHVHRVLLFEREGAIVGLEAGIIGTTGRPIDLKGADDLLRRMAVAALEGPSEAAVTAWLATAYRDCAGTCASEVAGLHVQLEWREDAAILTVEGR